MSVVVEVFITIFIVIGSLFLFVGSFGLAKLPDTMRRLHGPTKATTLGIGALLIASMIYFVFLHQASGIHEILITLFLFLTAPVTANMVAKAHIFRTIELHESLPPAYAEAGWATLTRPTKGVRQRKARAPDDQDQ
jgi:multicomponent K+:H+ antiporter subunit G